MSKQPNLDNLESHIQESLNGIKLLYKNRCFSQAKYCTYILIDQLAWLISVSETQVNIYFKNWLNKYFIKHYPEITAKEIWASRNGMLHNHSSISRDIVNKKVSRQLWFVDNLNHLNDVNTEFNSPDYFVVNTTRFLQFALLNAINEFMSDLKSGNVPDMNDLAEKLGKLLAEVKPD
ncbi:hypothetical protein [Acinetobacter baumannii]|uniref:hypothetical protein n=1 Tax=Acinetobacter baumannii TaxID=470 RepID=UPI001CDBE968|nr:hypothetical protein [Acinetobacter baumannii]MCA4272082.1 hypothetical protein [Acinetobacter baumannii]